MARPEVFNPILAALAKPSAASSDFDLNPDVVLPEGRKLRPAAVLIGLIETSGRLEVVLTKRASGLKHHPGQIAFPGGKQDAEDGSIEATALREAEEEIGLLPDNVDVLGVMPAHETITGFVVTPVLGRIRDEFDASPEQGEVAEVFRVPLDYLLKPAHYAVQSRRWRGEQRFYYTVPYGPYYIWGATARILRALAESHVA